MWKIIIEFQNIFPLLLFGIIIMQGRGQTSIDSLSDCQMANWIKFGSSSPSSYCTMCNTQTIYGGPSYFAQLIKSYSLSSHDKITIKAKLWSTIQLTGNSFFMVADNQLVLETIFDENLGNQGCGQIFQASLQLTIDHKCSSLTIYFYSTIPINWWAIKEYEVLIHEEDQNFFEGICYLNLSQLYQEINQKNVATISGWQVNGSPYTSLYFVLSLLGSFNPSQSTIIQKSFSITVNSYIQIQFKLISYDAKDFTVQVLIDNAQVHADSSSGQIACRAGNYCYLNQHFITPLIQQVQKTIVVKIQISFAQYILSGYTYSFGFRDFKLAQYTENQDKSCVYKNQYPCVGCFTDQFSIQEGCSDLINGICFKCKDGWFILQYTCYPQCGDSIITQNEECDDGNTIEFDGCHQCKFSCPQNCQHCQFGQCKQCQNQYSLIHNKCEIIVTDLNQSIEVISILQYFDGFYQNNNNRISQYQIIQEFYTTDLEHFFQLADDQLLNYLLNSNQVSQIQFCEQQLNNLCIICSNQNDFYIIEQFCSDDLNKDLQQLKNQCQKECLICSESLCLTCIEGWVQIDFKCQSICGDGLIVINSQEQCDDGNLIQNDGCFNCLIQCSPNCESCSYTPIPSCNICQKYYSFDSLNQCIPICGDGHIIQNYEECDDGNDIQYDGCFQCLIECKKNCKICDHGKCLDSCEYGYYFIDEQCQNICGDGIVTKQEECDDGNDIEFDGCFNWKKICLENCIDCNFGTCLSCTDNYYPVKNYCQLCGNGQIDQSEQCDDANIESNDGCSSDCQTEDGFYCILNSDLVSFCDEIPRLVITYIGIELDTQYVQLAFSKKVKLDTESTTQDPFTFQVFLEGNSNKQLECLLTLNPIIELSNSELLFATYRLSIQFLSYPDQISIISIKINNDIIDENGYIMDMEVSSQVALQVVRKKQVEVAQSCQSAGNVVIKLLGSSSLLMLAFGEVTTFIQILDVLQYYSFLKYINIDYPRNLQIFFQATDQISADSILDRIKFANFFQFTIGYEYIESFGQFDFYQINSELISNIQPLLLQLICLIFLEIFLTQYQKFYYRIFFRNTFLLWLEQKNSNCLQSITSKFHKINKELFRTEKLTSIKGVFQLFEANFWDLSFKLLLFLEVTKTNSNRVIISYIFCACFIYLTLFFIVNLLGKQDKLFKNMKNHELKQIALTFIKKLIVLIILVHCQFEIILQNILLVLINTTYVLMIIIFPFTSNRSDLITIIFIESPIIAFTSLNFAYSPIFVEFCNKDLRIIFGYIQISLLLFGLIAIFIKNMTVQIRKFLTYYHKYKQQESKKSINHKQQQLENLCHNVNAWNFNVNRVAKKF